MRTTARPHTSHPEAIPVCPPRPPPPVVRISGSDTSGRRGALYRESATCGRPRDEATFQTRHYSRNGELAPAAATPAIKALRHTLRLLRGESTPTARVGKNCMCGFDGMTGGISRFEEWLLAYRSIVGRRR